MPGQTQPAAHIDYSPYSSRGDAVHSLHAFMDRAYPSDANEYGLVFQDAWGLWTFD